MSGAQSGTAVVIEVATGKIRAAASYPTYDSNKPGAAKTNLANRAFWEAFEPGSTGKLMTMAAAMEQKVITPDTGVIVPIRLPRAGIRFKDNEYHGVEQMTATGVIAKSSNMGTMLIGERVAPTMLEDYYRKFGIGQKTAGQLPRGVCAASSPRPRSGTPPSATRSSSARATRSPPCRPRASSRPSPTRACGCRRRSSRPPPKPTARSFPPPRPTSSRVVSEDTAVKLSRMMEEVTGPDGTASAARIKGYRVAGKTGTADRYDEKIKGYNGFTASFIGYAPAENPKYVVGVFIQKPSAGMFGGMLAGPVFNQVMTYLIERTGAPPSPKSDLDYHVWAKKPLSENDPTVISNARAKRDGL